MKITFIYQKPGPDTVFEYIDENTIKLNGEEYIFPEDIYIFDSALPIMSAKREEDELHLEILMRSTSRCGKCPTISYPEEVSNDNDR